MSATSVRLPLPHQTLPPQPGQIVWVHLQKSVVWPAVLAMSEDVAAFFSRGRTEQDLVVVRVLGWGGLTAVPRHSIFPWTEECFQEFRFGRFEGSKKFESGVGLAQQIFAGWVEAEGDSSPCSEDEFTQHPSDFCFLCGSTGELTCCDSCPNSFHQVCSGLLEKSTLCEHCRSKSRTGSKKAAIFGTPIAVAQASNMTAKLPPVANLVQLFTCGNIRACLILNGESILVTHSQFCKKPVPLIALLNKSITMIDPDMTKSITDPRIGTAIQFIAEVTALMTPLGALLPAHMILQIRQIFFTHPIAFAFSCVPLFVAGLRSFSAMHASLWTGDSSCDLFNILVVLHNLSMFEISDTSGALFFSSLIFRDREVFLRASMDICANKNIPSPQRLTIPLVDLWTFLIINGSWLDNKNKCLALHRGANLELCETFISHPQFINIFSKIMKICSTGSSSEAAALCTVLLRQMPTEKQNDPAVLHDKHKVVTHICHRLISCIKSKSLTWERVNLGKSAEMTMEAETELFLECIKCQHTRRMLFVTEATVVKEFLQCLVNDYSIVRKSISEMLVDEKDFEIDTDEMNFDGEQEQVAYAPLTQVQLVRILAELHDETELFARLLAEVATGVRVAHRVMSFFISLWTTTDIPLSLYAVGSSHKFVNLITHVSSLLSKKKMLTVEILAKIKSFSSDDSWEDDADTAVEDPSAQSFLHNVVPVNLWRAAVSYNSSDIWERMKRVCVFQDFNLRQIRDVKKMEKSVATVAKRKENLLRVSRAESSDSIEVAPNVRNGSFKNESGYTALRSNSYVDRPAKLWDRQAIPVCACTMLNPCVDDSCVNRASFIECTASKCGAKSKCENRRLQKGKLVKVQPFSTLDGRGMGLRVKRLVSQGDFVIEYVGEVIHETEMQRRLLEYKKEKKKILYIMQCTSNYYLDAMHKGNFARFVNHSCDPNCVAEKWVVDGEIRIVIVAKQDLLPGTEITLEYNYEISDKTPIRCLCRSEKCRGWLTENPEGLAPPPPLANLADVVAATKARESKIRKQKSLLAHSCVVCGRSRASALLACGNGCNNWFHAVCLAGDFCPDCSGDQMLSADATRKKILEKKSSTYSPGDVVWAKMKGFPWWPARICPINLINDTQVALWDESTPILVEFFTANREPTHLWLSEDQVCVWAENYDKFSRQKIGNISRKQWLSACVREVNELLEFECNLNSADGVPDENYFDVSDAESDEELENIEENGEVEEVLELGGEKRKQAAEKVLGGRRKKSRASTSNDTAANSDLMIIDSAPTQSASQNKRASAK